MWLIQKYFIEMMIVLAVAWWYLMCLNNVFDQARVDDFRAMSEEEQLAMAINMSLNDQRCVCSVV